MKSALDTKGFSERNCRRKSSFGLMGGIILIDFENILETAKDFKTRMFTLEIFQMD